MKIDYEAINFMKNDYQNSQLSVYCHSFKNSLNRCVL